MTDQRTVTIRLRVTPAEKKALEAFGSISGYIRHRCPELADDPAPTVKPRPAAPKGKAPDEVDEKVIARRAMQLARTMPASIALREARREARDGKLSSVH